MTDVEVRRLARAARHTEGDDWDYPIGREEILWYDRKMHMGFRFQQLLFRLLILALKMLRSVRVFQPQFKNSTHEFLPSLTARLYFFIPAFRQELLSCLLTEQEMEIPVPEWSHPGYTLDDASELLLGKEWRSETPEHLLMLFNWDSFHQSLDSYFASSSSSERWSALRVKKCRAFSKSVLQTDGVWKQRMAKRG